MACTPYGVRLPTVPSGFKVGINGSNSHADRRNAHLSFFLKYKYHSRKVFAGKSFDSVSQSSRATASEKVLFPGTENEETLSSTEELEVPQIDSDDSQACQPETLALTSANHNPCTLSFFHPTKPPKEKKKEADEGIRKRIKDNTEVNDTKKRKVTRTEQNLDDVRRLKCLSY